MDKYEVVWCQMESANNLFAAPCEGHVFNLICFSMLFDSKTRWVWEQHALAIRVRSIAIIPQGMNGCASEGENERRLWDASSWMSVGVFPSRNARHGGSPNCHELNMSGCFGRDTK
jgi:hypothetical protein